MNRIEDDAPQRVAQLGEGVLEVAGAEHGRGGEEDEPSGHGPEDTALEARSKGRGRARPAHAAVEGPLHPAYHLASAVRRDHVKRSSLLPASALLAVLAWPDGALAQDAHYWTYGYGPVGQLTEGVLVGGVEDLSAVYYNPGALALIDKPRFVIGLTSIELANIDVPDAAGEGLELRPGDLRRRALDGRRKHRGEPRAEEPLRLRLPVTPRLRLGPRLQQRAGLRDLPRRAARASADSASGWSSTGSGAPGRTDSGTASRSASPPSSPSAASGAAGR